MAVWEEQALTYYLAMRGKRGPISISFKVRRSALKEYQKYERSLCMPTTRKGIANPLKYHLMIVCVQVNCS